MSVAMDDRYTCPRCGAEFPSPDELGDHVTHIHEISMPRRRVPVAA